MNLTQKEEVLGYIKNNYSILSDQLEELLKHLENTTQLRTFNSNLNTGVVVLVITTNKSILEGIVPADLLIKVATLPGLQRMITNGEELIFVVSLSNILKN